MEMDERVDYIEGEINLIKGEIQQALVELRDMVTVMETKVKEPESQVIEIRQGTSTAAEETAKPEKAKNEIEEVEKPAEEEVTEEEEEEIEGPVEEAEPVAELEEDEPEPTIEETPEPFLPPPSLLEAGQQSIPEDVVPAPSDSFQDLGSMLPDSGGSQYPDPPEGSTYIPMPRPQPVEVRALDIHSVANLIRWVGSARPRIGLDQLRTLLEIYQSTGHLPDTIEELILEAAKLRAVAEGPEDQGFTLEEYIDSLLQLHAIVSSLEYRIAEPGQTPAQPASSGNGSARYSAGSLPLDPITFDLGQIQVHQTPAGRTGPGGFSRPFNGSASGSGKSANLDANLVSNLMRWAGTVQPRIGEEQLETLLGVYRLTGNLPASVERILIKASKLDVVANDVAGGGFTLQEFIDSLLKLHGIVHSTEYQTINSPARFGQGSAVIRNRYG